MSVKLDRKNEWVNIKWMYCIQCKKRMQKWKMGTTMRFFVLWFQRFKDSLGEIAGIQFCRQSFSAAFQDLVCYESKIFLVHVWSTFLVVVKAVSQSGRTLQIIGGLLKNCTAWLLFNFVLKVRRKNNDWCCYCNVALRSPPDLDPRHEYIHLLSSIIISFRSAFIALVRHLSEIGHIKPMYA